MEQQRTAELTRIEEKLDRILKILTYHVGRTKDVLDEEAWTPEELEKELVKRLRERGRW